MIRPNSNEVILSFRYCLLIRSIMLATPVRQWIHMDQQSIWLSWKRLDILQKSYRPS